MALFKKTFVYQTRQGVEYKVDVSLPDEQLFAQDPVPIAIFFHGGGQCYGDRSENDWFPKYLQSDCLRAGIAFASADYSLLIPATGWDVIEDIHQLWRWLSMTLNDQLARDTAIRVDATRTVVVGQSGGGTPAMYAGLHARPRPRAVVTMYAMGGDYLNDHYVVEKKEPFFKFMTPDLIPLLPVPSRHAQILQGASTAPPTVEVAIEAFDNPRSDLAVFLFQTGTYLDILTGFEGLGRKLSGKKWEERAKEVPKELIPLIPSLAADEHFPPTYITHGQRDTCIPRAESRNFASVLSKLGVAHVFFEVPDADHGFDMYGYGGKDLNDVVPFLLKNL